MCLVEVFGVCWDEINWEEKVWIIFVERMKKRREYCILFIE